MYTRTVEDYLAFREGMRTTLDDRAAREGPHAPGIRRRTEHHRPPSMGELRPPLFEPAFA
jgi:hypothetical protein